MTVNQEDMLQRQGGLAPGWQDLSCVLRPCRHTRSGV